MNIRQAHEDDAEGIGRVHVDSWRSTYKNIIPNDILDNLKYEDKTNQWLLNIKDPNNFIKVAEIDQTIVGYAAAQPRIDHSTNRSGTLTSIYTLKKHQGNGLGKQLLREMFIYFKHQEIQSVYVEVLNENPTIHFYQKYGAEFVRDFDLNVGTTTIKESLYLWPSVDETLNILNQ